MERARARSDAGSSSLFSPSIFFVSLNEGGVRVTEGIFLGNDHFMTKSKIGTLENPAPDRLLTNGNGNETSEFACEMLGAVICS